MRLPKHPAYNYYISDDRYMEIERERANFIQPSEQALEDLKNDLIILFDTETVRRISIGYIAVL